MHNETLEKLTNAAKNKININLTNSAGCKLLLPTSNHDNAPPATLP